MLVSFMVVHVPFVAQLFIQPRLVVLPAAGIPTRSRTELGGCNPSNRQK
jgi:hypothetical protein